MQRKLKLIYQPSDEGLAKRQIDVVQSHEGVVSLGVVIDPATFCPVCIFLFDDSNMKLLAYIKQHDNLVIE